MNDVVLKGVLKMAKNLISPDQIKEAATGLIKAGIDFKNTIPLEPGEAHTAAIFYEINGAVYVAAAILNDENHIKRFEMVRPLDKVIDELIKKI